MRPAPPAALAAPSARSAGCATRPRWCAASVRACRGRCQCARVVCACVSARACRSSPQRACATRVAPPAGETKLAKVACPDVVRRPAPRLRSRLRGLSQRPRAARSRALLPPPAAAAVEGRRAQHAGRARRRARHRREQGAGGGEALQPVRGKVRRLQAVPPPGGPLLPNLRLRQGCAAPQQPQRHKRRRSGRAVARSLTARVCDTACAAFGGL